ncbi:hypothetical protein Sste5346_005873 [Sporothrix stenoceras]|uniref:CENP-V/GFA domain-containing protein n=1 Tax=Sporothrix stenoceras TaxID=5173 RepID=A0ABR3Z2W4_9PEZI
MPIRFDISCLCGTVAQSLTARPPPGHDPSKPIPITICHCNTCRQTSGVLCTSYCPIERPDDDKLDLLTVYTSSPGTERYFCKTCGCHVIRRRQSSAEDDGDLWEVATGVIADERRDDDDNTENDNDTPVLEYVRHEHVDDTGDGGLAVWMPTVGDRTMDGYEEPQLTADTVDSTTPTAWTVSASCHCGAVQFDIRPPDYDLAASRHPHSAFADLLVPYATTDPAITANPEDVKWWLRPSQDDQTKTTRWLAGTCACRSCRLATGFEIQTWTFVPRICIMVKGEPLTFNNGGNSNGNTPPKLSAYESSHGVERNFCNCCGATVFWHDVWRPDLIDISKQHEVAMDRVHDEDRS